MGTQVISPVVVGRAAELRELEETFATVVDGSPATILIGGESGVGKTRLVEELLDHLPEPAEVLKGGCIRAGAEDLPYAPFTAALRDLTRAIGWEGLTERLPRGDRLELARLLPGAGVFPGTDTSTSQVRLFEEILTLLAGLAADSPVVLVIEDVHWADHSTRGLIDFLVRNQQALPGTMIVVTYRSEHLGCSDPLRPMLAELDRVAWVSRRELSRLGRRDMGTLIRTILGEEPDPELIDAVYRRTDGNPLFVEALLASCPRGEAALPDSLRDLLLAPVQQLTGAEQALLRTAAVGGAQIHHGLLAAVTELEEDRLAEALRAAIAANLLTVSGESYAFRHGLIHEAIYSDMLPSERPSIHRRYAEAIQADPALVPEVHPETRLAYHWHAAGDRRQALSTAARAATEAEISVGHAEQVHLLGVVLELWPDVPDAETLVGADRITVLEQAVIAASRAGDAEQGAQLATWGLDELSDRDPVRAAGLLEHRSQMLRDLGRQNHLDDLRQAVRLVPADHPRKPAILAALAARLMDIPVHDEADAVAGDALHLARQRGDDHTEAQVLLLLAMLRSRSGHLDEELPNLRRAQERAEMIRDEPLLMRAIHAEARALEAYGSYEQAATAAERGVDRARRAHLARRYVGAHSVNLASALFTLGRWDEALRAIDDALDSLPPPAARIELLCLRGAIALSRGHTELPHNALKAARQAIDHDVESAHLVLPVARLAIGLHMLEGNPEQALAVSEETLAAHDLQRSPLYTWPFLVLAARNVSLAGDTVARSDELVVDLQRVAAKLPTISPVQETQKRWFDAEVARTDGILDRLTWDSIVAAWADLGAPYRVAQASLVAAEAAIADGGDRETAAAYLEQAARVANDLGARPLHEQIDRLAQRARLRLDAPVAEVADADVGRQLGLTERQLEVLRLVAEGHSNQAIAEELFISPKTASVHVSHILTKLGVTSRIEAAATAHRLGLGVD